MGKVKAYYPLHILCINGWKWHSYNSDPLIQMDDSDDYAQYTLKVLGEYETTVRAVVAQHSKHLCINGHYGVLWLDAVDYECQRPYSDHALIDMLFALELAEENLLKIGMPFAPDYRFHGNKANRKRRNEKLRRLYDLERKEEIDNRNGDN